MPSTYSPLLQLELIAKGEQKGVWGDTTNKNLGTLLEDAIAGVAEVDISSGSVTLTTVDGAPDEARCSSIILTGTYTGTAQVIAPAHRKTYIVHNKSNASILFRDTSTASGVTIAPGRTTFVWWDGDKFSPVLYGDLPMGGYKLTGLGAATTSGDALSYGAAAAVTDLTASGTVTVSGGTANGVAYLNGSKVLTTGSALVFDGTNLGVGTSSPSTFIQAFSSSANGLSIAGSTYPLISLVDTTDSTNYRSWIAQGDTTMYLWNKAAGSMLFSTNDTECMRIDSSGNLLVGTTSIQDASGEGIKIRPNGDGANYPRISIVTAATTNEQNFGVSFYSTGASAYRFYVGAGGTISATSTSISAISDISLKENIRDLETGLNEIMALRPRRFDWKEETQIGEKNVAGFIAQELEEVLPELVYDYKYNENETKKSIKMGDILPTLVKAIQELKAELDAIKAEVAELKQGA